MRRSTGAATLALAAALAMAGCGAAGPAGQSGGASPATPGANWEEEYKAAGLAQGEALGVPCDDFQAQGATTVEAIYQLSAASLYPEGVPADATASSLDRLAPAIQAGVVPADAPVSTILQLQSEVAHEVCGF